MARGGFYAWVLLALVRYTSCFPPALPCRVGASRGAGCGIRSDGIIRKAGLGGGVQEFISLLEASSSTAAETVPSASSWFEDVARTFVVPDPDFASKLLPFVTLTIVIGTAVGKYKDLEAKVHTTALKADKEVAEAKAAAAEARAEARAAAAETRAEARAAAAETRAAADAARAEADRRILDLLTRL